MKKYFTKLNLLSFLFYFVVMGLASSWMDGWRSGILQAFFCALMFFFMMPWLQKFNMKSVTKMMMKTSIEDEENGILCGGANHFKSIEGVGGKMVLFHDELVFKSHKINIQRHEIRMPLSTIADITTYQVWGLFPTGLKITLQNGSVEKFVVGKPDEWVTAVLMAKALAY